ncbi:MAG TPA: hypothetical protein ENI68_02210 [Gammaproteobacteria bacterium]|nr:hypothetical protein [Gammaproteobacteria bacterium]
MEMDVNGYGGMLFGIQFEDFLSRDTAVGNPVDDYLKRRGWRESVRGRRYLSALRSSVLSLYEVVDVVPGQHCDVQDLVRGGRPLRVFEKAGTEQMVKWDRIAARVIYEQGKHGFSGGILPLSPEAAQGLLRVLNASREGLQATLDAVLADEQIMAEASSPLAIDDLHLREACPTFSNIWLMYTLERLHAPLPELYNGDGDPITFIETHFPLTAETRAAVIQRLNAAPEWVTAGDEPPFWNWLEAEPPARKDVPQEGQSFDTLLDGHQSVSGNLELGRRALIFSTNSEARAERGKAVLGTLLAGLVGAPLSQVQSPEQALAEADDDGNNESIALDIDPETAAAVMQDYFDQHYQNCLDEPIPVLGNRTPRQCAASPAHRPEVIAWLKQLENSEQRRITGTGQKPYDTRWLWQALGLEP